MKDAGGNNHYAVDAFAPDPNEAEDAGSEATVIRLMARYNLNRAVCLEMIDEVVEAFSSGPSGTDCEEDGNALKKLNSLHRNAWKYLIEYQQNQKLADEVRMSTRTMALVLGFKMAAGGDCVTDLARKNNFDKQTINKAAIHFIELLGLPPMEGQRDETARANMSKARKEQIKH